MTTRPTVDDLDRQPPCCLEARIAALTRGAPLPVVCAQHAQAGVRRTPPPKARRASP